jgi:hypothetical protein
MIAMGLIGRIPVFASGHERVLGIAYCTGSVYMYMETMGTYRVPVFRRLVRRQSGNINCYPNTSRYILESHLTPYLGCEGTTANIGHRHSRKH